MATKFVSLNTFIKNAFNNSDYKNEFGSVAKFIELRGKNALFSEWIESLKGAQLSVANLTEIAKGYIKYHNTSASGIANVVGWLEKHNSNKLPVVYGITTSEFWINKLS